jgi:WD repeat-containing protein mio
MSSIGPAKGSNGDPSFPLSPSPPSKVRALGSPQRSALSSTPHYSTVYGGGATSSITATSIGRGVGEDSTPGIDEINAMNSGDMSNPSTTAATEIDFNNQLSSSMRIGSTFRQYHKSGSNVSSGNVSSVSNNNNQNTHHSSSSYNNSNSPQVSISGAILRPQVTFCPGWHDMIASINCVSSSSTSFVRPPPRITSSSGGILLGKTSVTSFAADANHPSTSSRKLGPIMLELKRVELVEDVLRRQPSQIDKKIYQDNNNMNVKGGTGILRLPSSVIGSVTDYHSEDDDVIDHGNDNEDDDFAQSFFTTRTVGVSRGNPSLGLSVASTCMTMSTVADYDSITAATGTTTGALCIHRFEAQDLDEIDITNDDDHERAPIISFSAAPIEYFHNSRHHRQSTAIAWRPVQSSHVAVGLVGSTAVGSLSHPVHHHRRPGPGMRTSGDREFCCFLWDIHDNNKTTTSPIQKLCHNLPVASLDWMMDGQTLVVGGHQRTLHLYDMRVAAGTNAPPLSAHVHETGVHGIKIDPYRPYLMATFCRGVGEPVKLFDIRRMEKAVSEIKIPNGMYHQEPSSLSNAAQRAQQATVEAIHWSILEPGMLSIASGDSIQHYDTSSGARPTLVKINHCRAGTFVKDIALYRGKIDLTATDSLVKTGSQDTSEKGERDGCSDDENISDKLISMLYPHRMLAVLSDRTIQDIAIDSSAPVAFSRRDGRLVHSLGPHLFVGSPYEGPAAMEKTTFSAQDDDISALMMKRAKGIQPSTYSMNPEANIKLMSREVALEDGTIVTKTLPANSNHRELLRVWSWIDRVEALSFQDMEDLDDDNIWTSKCLLDAGTWQLLEMDAEKTEIEVEVSLSETVGCNVYDSPTRRAALVANGWAGKYDLTIVMAECEAMGEFERSAALAVWHENVGAAVVALQRGSQSVRRQAKESLNAGPHESLRYAETLDLIAMCIAGYGGKTVAQLAVWRTACASLLQREDLSMQRAKQSRIAYLRGLCDFLLNVGTNESFSHVLDNPYLSLSDRVAFACRFLGNVKLKLYLQKCIEKCQRQGNIEGLVITGLSKNGIKILQSFVDIYCDIQTTALVVSRIVLPSDWTVERRTCVEWVECYRNLLNNWQMWQSRAMFDVDRADVLRRFKARFVGTSNNQRRMQANPRARQSPQPPDPDVLPSIPAQMEVRCNYCSSPISLKRNAGMTNQWLSKMQPLLNCCPQCRKPLPRCSVCLLSLGALNPYMELTRQRQGLRGIVGKTSQNADDLSSISSMSFAEWYTWCMRYVQSSIS